jgi:hypothetical protein
MGACDHPCRAQQRGRRAHSPGHRPRSGVSPPGRPCRSREPLRYRPGRLRRARGGGPGGRLGQRPGSWVLRAGYARRTRGPRRHRPGRTYPVPGRGTGGRGRRDRRPGSWGFPAGHPDRGLLTAEVPASQWRLPGARQRAFLARVCRCGLLARVCRCGLLARVCRCGHPAREGRRLPRPRGARLGNPEPGPPEGRSQAVRCLQSHRARSHPAHQCRSGHAGPDRPAHPDSPWRERILLRG